MPQNNQTVKLVRAVAKEMGIKLSSRIANKAVAAMDAIEDRALTIPDIEAYLRLWSDPTGERAVRNVMALATV